MVHGMVFKGFLPLFALALTTLNTLPATAQQEIGTVAYAQPVVRGTPPDAATRRLEIGSRIHADEVISSSGSGQAQLIFADQTTLSIGPNTTITLDTFVYDPASGSGEMGVNLAEGTMRFIGGRLSRGQEAVISTAGSNIGIRGSTGIITHMNGETAAIFVAGDRMCVGTGSARNCTSRQGGVLGRQGYVGRVNPEFLSQIVDMVQGIDRRGAGAAPGGNTAPSATGSSTGFAGTTSGTAASTSGAQFDGNIFDSDMTLDSVMNALTSRRILDRSGGDCLFFYRDGQIYCN